ncbi:hypothetical protein Bca52824_027241 [Brassica carinata]|uniref:Uncharacterized protein n=1 Tax=Brassica carinata TaxID=52824 RepID=A0A8X7SI37_BRACI|nr:hypothetical protein Bca52824_027241 [Brassica carinata]
MNRIFLALKRYVGVCEAMENSDYFSDADAACPSHLKTSSGHIQIWANLSFSKSIIHQLQQRALFYCGRLVSLFCSVIINSWVLLELYRLMQFALGPSAWDEIHHAILKASKIELKGGLLEQFTHEMEPFLRKQVQPDVDHVTVRWIPANNSFAITEDKLNNLGINSQSARDFRDHTAYALKKARKA